MNDRAEFADQKIKALRAQLGCELIRAFKTCKFALEDLPISEEKYKALVNWGDSIKPTTPETFPDEIIIDDILACFMPLGISVEVLLKAPPTVISA